jgi:hypothetical protein
MKMRRRNPTTGIFPSRAQLAFSSLPLRGATPIIIVLLFLLSPSLAPRLWSGSIFAADSKHEKPYALIFGTVWGPDSRPLYGIKIKIRRESDKKARWEVFSDHSGEFAQRVPAGKQDYVVWADLKRVTSATGKPLHAEEIKVHIDNDERADIGVHLTE